MTKETPAATKAAEPVSRKSALGYRVNEFIVYPAHGVGQIVEISSQEIAGMQLELFVINFDKEKMVLRVPLDKAKQIGMRKLAGDETLEGAIKTLRGRARVKRTMWSRRAQEYEAKINSGDLIAIAEVVRDLFRNENQPEQSYSERQLYEAALERMAREVATIRKVTEDEAIIELEAILAQTTGGARRRNEPDAA
ncbi:MAG: CarD family transcriptional regulator [Parvibaculales bacterium]